MTWILAKLVVFIYDRSITVRTAVLRRQHDKEVAASKATERYHGRLRKTYGPTKFKEFKERGLV